VTLDPREIFPSQARSLKDGREVELRAVCRTDEAELVQAFHRMSDEARYMRFGRAVREPNIDRLRKALASFPESGFGIVATVPAEDGIDIAGGAAYMVGQDPARCEFSISVVCEFGGLGLATMLLSALIDTARARGVEEMEGYVLAANQPMLRLASRLGFSNEVDPDDFGMRTCRLRLDGAGSQNE
jgi:RimJ/RimL family protein N-acetyltransferase